MLGIILENMVIQRTYPLEVYMPVGERANEQAKKIMDIVTMKKIRQVNGS